MTSPDAPSATAESSPVPVPKRIRWWPAIVIVALSALAVGWIRFVQEDSHQHLNLRTTFFCLNAVVLLLLWWLFFSRLRWRIRLAAFGGFIAVVVALAGLVRIRGVTGDLLPVLEWRWQKDRSAGLILEKTAPAAVAVPTNVIAGAAPTGGWPQFLGPNRNATLPGPRLARDWAARPPQELWRRPVGAGWSGFAVAQGCAVTQEQRGPEELVTCYDAQSGKLLWAHADAARYSTTLAGEGPRATPTIDGDRVYAVGALGLLNCLDLRTGRPIWGTNVITENNGHVPGWGLSVSPLVVGDLVVAGVGGGPDRSLVAYRKNTGEFVWGGGHDRVGYSSPVLFDLGGARQILVFNAASLAGHDPSDGRLLWEQPWPSSNPTVAVPVLLPGDRVLVSSGYGVGSAAFEIKPEAGGGWSAARVWKSLRLKAKFTNVVFDGGHIYGLDDGILVCVEAATGELKWKEGRYGHGQVILVDKLLLVMAENGEVVLLEPVPEARRELARFTAFKTKTWNPPALAGEFLFVRTDLEAACFRLPVER